ncbi:MAG: hypothetical protein AB7E34_05295 [Acidaminococcaceae bacterium]
MNALANTLDTQKIAERKKLAELFAKNAFEQVHRLSDEMKLEEGSVGKVLLHAVVAGITAKLGGDNFAAGSMAGAVNEIMNGEISRYEKAHNKGLTPAEHQWLSAAVGAIVNSATGSTIQTGAGVAVYGTKWNMYGKEPKYEGAFKLVGDKWYKLVDGEYIETDDRPLAGQVYWKENPDDVGNGYDYKRGTGEYDEDIFVEKKVDYSWHTIIDGKNYGFTILSETDTQRQLVIREGAEQFVYAVAIGSSPSSEIDDLIKFAKTIEGIDDRSERKGKTNKAIYSLISEKIQGMIISLKGIKNNKEGL